MLGNVMHAGSFLYANFFRIIQFFRFGARWLGDFFDNTVTIDEKKILVWKFKKKSG